MTTINVTVSKWTNGNGFSYTTDIDPMEIPGMENLEEMAKAYTADFNAENELADSEDFKLDFYTGNADGNPACSIWISEI